MASIDRKRIALAMFEDIFFTEIALFVQL